MTITQRRRRGMEIYWCILVQCFFFKDFRLFIHERHTERSRDIVRRRSRLLTGSLMWDSILGPQDHALSQRQMLNHWATQASRRPMSFNVMWKPVGMMFGREIILCPFIWGKFWHGFSITEEEGVKKVNGGIRRRLRNASQHEKHLGNYGGTKIKTKK